jgi:signal transduction histidine kinase/ligand-binding sensor domain-containing protein
MKIATVALLLIAATAPAAAAPRAGGSDTGLSGYSLTSWTDGDGRPLGAVYAIAQHDDGYLWIGAETGLLRFDGSRFLAWDSLSDAPLPRAAVTALYVSHDRALWVGFGDGAGIRRIDGWQVDAHERGPSTSGPITDIVENRDGTMWAVADGRLFVRRGDAWDPVDLPWPDEPGRVLHAYVSPHGQLWIATRWGVFQAIDDRRFRFVAAGFIWGVTEGADGTMWTTDIVSGFTRMGSRTHATSAHPGAGHRLMLDRSGHLWIGTFSEGLWRAAGGGGTADSEVERADLRTGLSSDSVQTLLEDRDGDVWIGTTGGLHRFTRRTLTPINNIGFVVTVETAGDGGVWACRTNGVIHLTPDPQKWKQAGGGSAGPDIRSLYLDAQGTLWVGAAEGLFRAVDGRLIPVRLRPGNQIAALSILPAAQGGLWLGDGNWLYRWDGTRVIPYDASTQSPGATRISFAGVDRTGRLWLQFPGRSFGFADASGAYHPLESGDPNGPQQHDVYAVYEDDDHVVWIGHSGGLTRYENGRMATVTHVNGLPEDRVWAIVEDADRRLWLSVNRGLVRVDAREVTHALADPSYRLRYRVYDAHDGLAGASVGVIHSLRASDGTLWFVRGGGLTILRPADLDNERQRAPAPVRIETVVANERRIGPAGTSFPAGTRRLQINYTALTLGSPNRVRFRYKLEGVDAGWVDAGARRGAFYTNLTPRPYRFVVEAIMEDGTWNTSSASWNFEIEPAFYQTTAFRAAAGLALLLAIWGAWRLRLRVLEQQFSLVLAERARLSREIHDTLLQSLLGVMLQFDGLARTLGPSSTSVRDQLVRLRRTVEAHIRDARQCIHNLRSPLHEERDLLKALIEFGERAVADTPTRFTWSASGTPRRCPPEFESQLLRVGQEAIVNAVRHADASVIHLDVRFDADALVLRVADDGRGFAAATGRGGEDDHFGLTMMRERVEQLHGRIQIASVDGEGTRVEASVPLVGRVRQLWTAAS